MDFSTDLYSLLVLFPYADRYRYAGQVAASRPLGDLFVSKLDYDSGRTDGERDQLCRYSKGALANGDFLGVLAFFVPRALWTSKPGATGSELLSEHVGFPQSNVSSPLWVEALHR